MEVKHHAGFMTPTELKTFIYREFPLAQAQGVEIVRADDQGVEISAPLDKNRNHLGTAYGGSLSSLLILSCYASLFYQMEKEGYRFHLVIKEESTKFLLPVEEDIRIIGPSPDKDEYLAFTESFKRKGRARMRLTAEVVTKKGIACTFNGEFVAIQ